MNCGGGKDSNAGTSPSTAWQSLSRANKASLQPGDSLLLKRECSWTGPLNAKWSGTASAPILIGAYGSGERPRIAHANSSNVRITGAYQIVEDLQTKHVLADYPTIASNGQPYGWKLGVTITDAAHHNTLRRLRTSGHALGINFGDGTHHNQVLDSDISDNFGLWSDTTAATGVLLHGNANTIAYNRFEHNTALKVFGKGTSLEVYNSTNANVHHNVSYDRQFAELGSGAIISADNVFAYNTHWSDSAPSASGRGARFIVTRGPGCKFGPVWRTVLLNNTVYLNGAKSEGVVAGCTNAAAAGDVLTMRNNIIVATQKAYSIGGGKAVESHNLYWTPGGGPLPNQFLQGQAPSASSLVAAPKFIDAGGRDVHLQATSPAINAASQAALNAGFTTDLDGTPVPSGAAPDIGSDER